MNEATVNLPGRSPADYDAVAALRDATAAMERAAWEEGIGPDDPLGRWIRGIRLCMVHLAAIMERQCSVALAEAKTLMLAEVELGRQELAKLDRLGRQLENRAIAATAETKSTLKVSAAEMMERFLRENRETMRKAIQDEWKFTERRFHQRRQWKVGGLIGAAFVGCFVAGVASHWIEARPAMSFYSACLAHHAMTADGRAWCALP